jgi:hypothetical protein
MGIYNRRPPLFKKIFKRGGLLLYYSLSYREKKKKAHIKKHAGAAPATAMPGLWAPRH